MSRFSGIYQKNIIVYHLLTKIIFYFKLETQNNVNEHIRSSANKILRYQLITIHKNAQGLATKPEPLLSRNEYDFLMEGMDSKSIPNPKVLIKDHKEKVNGNFPTRLIILPTNFTATFSKVGYLGLKPILNNNETNYNCFTVTRASNLKSNPEKLKITRENSTLASLHKEKVYPSIRFSIIQKAVTYYTSHLPTTTKNKIRTCLKMIKFSMASCLIFFSGKHY